jgi:hypothetical protein
VTQTIFQSPLQILQEDSDTLYEEGTKSSKKIIISFSSIEFANVKIELRRLELSDSKNEDAQKVSNHALMLS